jgi:hypothetical protein
MTNMSTTNIDTTMPRGRKNKKRLSSGSQASPESSPPPQKRRSESGNLVPKESSFLELLTSAEPTADNMLRLNRNLHANYVLLNHLVQLSRDQNQVAMPVSESETKLHLRTVVKQITLDNPTNPNLWFR